MNTAVPPGNCVTHGYHGLAACPRCSSTLPAALISAGQADAAVSPFDLIRKAHAKAMEALGADVHPFSGSAIRPWEKVLADALDQLQRDHEALAAERGEADPRLTVEHVERLERRIKEQREHITRLIGMREPGDRYTRKRMAALERALGRVSLGAEKLKEDFAAYRVRTDVQRDAAVREAETLREAVELALSGLPDPVHPGIPRHAVDGLVAAKIVLMDALGDPDPGNVEAARATLASSRDTTETNVSVVRRLRTLSRKASASPWWHDEGWYVLTSENGKGRSVAQTGDARSSRAVDDAALIAESRNYLDALLDCAEALAGLVHLLDDGYDIKAHSASHALITGLLAQLDQPASEPSA